MFCLVVLSFIGTYELTGVTSFCRFWGFGEKAYNALLHFFRYSIWSLDMLVVQWAAFVLSQKETVMVNGRAVLVGDHTYVPKDGRRMAGVVTLYQHSDTQSKPSYFRGHNWGAIALLIGSLKAPFCIPLNLKIHQGMCHIGQKNKSEDSKCVLGTQIVQMAIDFTLKHNIPSVLTLDAFFPTAGVFRLAASVYSIEIQQPLVTLIIKAKKSYVAYEPAPPEKGKVGRPKKYGKKIKLMELFDHSENFSEQKCTIYGKVENVSFAVFNLLWKPTGSLIRFVLAVTSHGPIILMCSDLNHDPLLALELYCFRTRIETMFDMLKNVIGAFNYRFWSKVMPRHSRRPLKNKDLKEPSSQNIGKVKRCWEAYEKFVMLGAVALGILQMIALKYADSVWRQFDAYLRSRSRHLPSERTVKYVVARFLIRNIFIITPNAIIQEIKERFSGKKEQKNKASPNSEHDDYISG